MRNMDTLQSGVISNVVFLVLVHIWKMNVILIEEKAHYTHKIDDEESIHSKCVKWHITGKSIEETKIWDFISRITGGLPIAYITTIRAASIQNLEGVEDSIRKVQTVSMIYVDLQSIRNLN